MILNNDDDKDILVNRFMEKAHEAIQDAQAHISPLIIT
jgi:hypothetical protein